jgi:hypothetical protein
MAMSENTLSGLDISRYRFPGPARSESNYCARCGSGQYTRRMTKTKRDLVCEDISACHRRMMAGKLRLVAKERQD